MLAQRRGLKLNKGKDWNRLSQGVIQKNNAMRKMERTSRICPSVT